MADCYLLQMENIPQMSLSNKMSQTSGGTAPSKSGLQDKDCTKNWYRFQQWNKFLHGTSHCP
jgi:hypothetical protein